MDPLFWYLIVAIGLLLIWFFIHLKKKQEMLEANFQQRFKNKDILFLDKVAVLHAQESEGYSQSSGMGYLVLTEQELYYEMVFFGKIFPIPLNSIKRVSETKRLGGKSTLWPMLHIEYKDSTGNPDSIALRVKELSKWQTKIKSAMRQIKNR